MEATQNTQSLGLIAPFTYLSPLLMKVRPPRHLTTTLTHIFTEASTIPLAAMTAAIGLYQLLGLPAPWSPTTTPTPVIIYGGSSAVGSFAIQLAIQSNIHPLIVVAGKSCDHVASLIDKSKGDEVLDYRVGPAELVVALRATIQKTGKPMLHAFDTISEHGSYLNLSEVMAPEGAKIVLVQPSKDFSAIPGHIEKAFTYVGTVHGQNILGAPKEEKAGTQVGDKDFGAAYFKLMGRGLEKGWFKGHPYEVKPGGLGAVEQALTDLKAGKASAVKFVFRVADTEGVKK